MKKSIKTLKSSVLSFKIIFRYKTWNGQTSLPSTANRVREESGHASFSLGMLRPVNW